jgi:peptide/nickel transport system permease protein
VAAQLLRQAGFKVDLQAMDWQTLVGRRAKKDAPDKGGWHMFLTAWNVFDVWSPIANPTMDTRGEKSGWFGWATDDKLVALRNEFMRATDDGVKKKLADQIHARAFEIGTHAPLGEYMQPMAARKNISGFFITNGNIYWNLKKNCGPPAAGRRGRPPRGPPRPAEPALRRLARRSPWSPGDRSPRGCMNAFLPARRLLSTIPVLLIVSVLVFLMLRLTPGDPAAVLAGDAASTEQIAQIRTSPGAGPLHPRAVLHLVRPPAHRRPGPVVLLQDRGHHADRPAAGTHGVAGADHHHVIAVLVAVPLGVLAAWRFGGWLDRALMGFSVLGFSVPVFVLAYLLIWLVSPQAGLAAGAGLQAAGRRLRALAVPPDAAGDHAVGDLHRADRPRHPRQSVLETLGEDYIRTARAKGLPEAKVLMRHALANAAVPIVTVIGIGIALLIGGVVVTESVYAIPGLGRLTVDAVLARDFPTIQGVILLFSSST